MVEPKAKVGVAIDRAEDGAKHIQKRDIFGLRTKNVTHF